jgi:hypothetical protein
MELDYFYWNGPCGVKIPNTVCRVIAQDGINSRDPMGETEMGGSPELFMTDKQYREKYAELKEDGNWYWKLINSYWIGPCEVYIPKSIKFVTAQDGVNYYYPDHSTTKMLGDEDAYMSDDVYREKFAKLEPDGNWYWKK